LGTKWSEGGRTLRYRKTGRSPTTCKAQGRSGGQKKGKMKGSKRELEKEFRLAKAKPFEKKLRSDVIFVGPKEWKKATKNS